MVEILLRYNSSSQDLIWQNKRRDWITSQTGGIKENLKTELNIILSNCHERPFGTHLSEGVKGCLSPMHTWRNLSHLLKESYRNKLGVKYSLACMRHWFNPQHHTKKYSMQTKLHSPVVWVLIRLEGKIQCPPPNAPFLSLFCQSENHTKQPVLQVFIRFFECVYQQRWRLSSDSVV